MSTPSQSRSLPLLLVLALAVGCFAVSPQSFWIDEAQSALKAMEPTLPAAFRALNNEHNSNMQMPLHIAYFWAWAQLFGASEVSLRGSNVVWYLVDFLAIWHFLRRHLRLRNLALLLFCIHPFVHYYVNEARAYAMELSGAFLMAGCLFDAMDRPEELLPASWWWCYGAGLFIICGATVVGVPWAFFMSVALLAMGNVRRSLGRALVPALVFVPLLIALAGYLAWTFMEKVRNAYLPMTFPSVLSVFYELLGFLGLGPGRIDLRVNSVSSTRAFLLPLACLGVPLAIGLALAAWWRFFLTRGRLITVLLITGIPTVLTFALGFMRHARMLARHFSPLFPFILMAEVCAVAILWDTGRATGRIAACMIVLALACSSIELRLAPRHEREDYRTAAAAARQGLADHKTVWWGAAPEGAQYYHLAIGDDPGNSALLVFALPDHFNAAPDEVILSKPDLYDATGTLTAYFAAHHYYPAERWQGFTLWEKPTVAN